jgi:multidrug resistance efflux pump
MICVVILYRGLVYLLFFRFRLLTPPSTQAGITGCIVQIAPHVSGRVVAVHAQRINLHLALGGSFEARWTAV